MDNLGRMVLMFKYLWPWDEKEKTRMSFRFWVTLNNFYKGYNHFRFNKWNKAIDDICTFFTIIELFLLLWRSLVEVESQKLLKAVWMPNAPNGRHGESGQNAPRLVVAEWQKDLDNASCQKDATENLSKIQMKKSSRVQDLPHLFYFVTLKIVLLQFLNGHHGAHGQIAPESVEIMGNENDKENAKLWRVSQELKD